jgi:outer membrane protein TolC
MIKKLLIILFFPVMVQAQGTHTLNELFDSLKTHPQTIADQLDMEKALVGKRMATSNLYPNLSAFGTYDYANTPTGMLPIAPNDLLAMVKDQTVPQPFSQNIFRVGASISMPVFMKSIYTMAAKAKMMYTSAEDKMYINLLKNEAMIVSLNANLQYMEKLEQALNKKRESLLKTKEIINIKVNNNRAPKSALLKINNGLNEIDLMLNNIAVKRNNAVTMIQKLTGIILDKPVEMTQTGTYQDGDLKALDPLRKKVEADRLGVKAEKEKLWPALVLHGNYNHSMANAYNNGLRINEDFGTIGLVLKIPIFTMKQYASIKKSNLMVKESENKLAEMQLDLSSQANQLQNNLKIVENQISLYQNSLKDKESLLTIAKVAYQNDRMTIEDYLKYEDDVVMEKSRLNKSIADKWQTLMKLAVIYGNNIEQIVK